MFYRKPGKLAATTAAVWAGILTRREGVSVADAPCEVAAMIADSRLIEAEA